eukprot:CAMPEP_0176399976 /NCGR_PEP_ID=MMETSP0126-20121128/47191_1 /TAXON_ID=141414 ORGANISM="Strombidinopsis acuminatum, Strain SPMC142" /NCGR_SAMPLE_ID=MMETSP0126 /ASSEMBLY_ACC=CAM_ASM_000229 /LENGTH=213 /DNA_ID=CAMNT_0017775881 /DNA_START=3872 /DNA_END=4513 /DNA_ORIENTATION=+
MTTQDAAHKPTNLNDLYKTSDHYATTYLKQNYYTDNIAGFDIVGQYYMQVIEGYPRQDFTVSMTYGDQWDDPLEYDFNVFINNIPYPINNFPSNLGTLDPEGRNKTTYFDDFLGDWFIDDPDGGELFTYDMAYYCADNDASYGDYLIFDISYSDGRDRPNWLGIGYYDGLIYGLADIDYASELVNLKITCTDQFGGSYSYFRSVLVNAHPMNN